MFCQWLDCDNNNAPIEGATSAIFPILTSGTYAVKVTLGDLEQISACRTVTTVGILDDLASELDDAHLKRFLSRVASLDCQCFISAIDDRLYQWCKSHDAAMFHVEHGRITRA